MITAARLTISMALTIAIWLIATILIARAQEAPLAPARFKGWQRILAVQRHPRDRDGQRARCHPLRSWWDDLGRQSVRLRINRNALYFNGRQCLPLQGW
jgi:hypothetical protein